MKTTPKGTPLQIILLKGKEYLPVAQRLIWFREEHPDAGIQTEILERNDTYVISKAVITHPSGRILATASKREDYKHFPDALEKSETGAIGRALALCGYGTQFAEDLNEQDRIVDSPVEAKKKVHEEKSQMVQKSVPEAPENGASLKSSEEGGWSNPPPNSFESLLKPMVSEEDSAEKKAKHRLILSTALEKHGLKNKAVIDYLKKEYPAAKGFDSLSYDQRMNTIAYFQNYEAIQGG